MSDTIQARRYNARQAALFPQHPTGLIDAAESLAQTLAVGVSLPSPGFYGHRDLHGANVYIVCASHPGRNLVTPVASGTTVMMVSPVWSTTSAEMTLELDDDWPSESNWNRWAGLAKDALRKAASAVPRQTTDTARWRVERLSELQATFGFTIQDLAAVLGITRPQLYKWLDAANDIKLQEASRARLAAAQRIAKEWASRSKTPLSAVSKEPLEAGGTVFDMLAAEAINEKLVLGAFNQLMAKIEQKPQSHGQRLREAGFTRRQSARSLPSDE